MQRRYKYNTTNRCDKCDNLEAKLYEVIIVDDEWDEAIEADREVERVDHKVCVCTKCGHEEII